MEDALLDRELKLFIAEYVQSVEKLEILLLTSSNALEEWTVESVYESVKTGRTSISQRLKELVENGFLVELPGESPRYRFQPRGQRMEQLVSSLALAYKRLPVRVIEAIYSPATESLREFARAFRLKPKQ